MRRLSPVLLAAIILAACSDDPAGLTDNDNPDCPYMRPAVRVPSGISASVNAPMCWREAIPLQMSAVTDINEHGQVLGVKPNTSQIHFIWSKSGEQQLQIHSKQRPIVPMDMNNLGQVVGGEYIDSNANSRALYWDAGGQSFYILGVDGNAMAYGINDSGMIVGQQDGKAFVKLPSGEVINPAPNAFISSAVAVNNRGEVVGTYRSSPPSEPGSQTRGFLWSQAGGFVDMGPGNPSSINENGVVVGRLGNGNDGFIWTQAGGMKPISGILVGAPRVSAHGEVLGFKWLNQNGDAQAVTWSESTGESELRIDGKQTPTSPSAINSFGDVVGVYKNAGGQWVPVLWTWSPERYR